MSRDYQLNRFSAPAELQIDYARELNAQQYAAVTAEDGPALVIAGAGAGKTRTLTYRVAWLIEHGTPPDRILLLTFTNKAAKEMMRRVADLLGNDVSQLWGGTFHSVGNRILRRHAEVLGWRPDFTILDREDAKDLIQACVDEAGIDVKETRFPKPDVLGDIFSMALNTGRSIAETLAQDYDHFAPLANKIEDIAARYRERKQATNGMDFDDLLTQWLRVLKEFPDLRDFYQRRFQFILVDEYQDTNSLQGELIDRLAAVHKNVMVVGDDAQSIYAWRGANFKNILEFPQRYFGCQTFKIEVNYRSTPEILAFANAAIAPNIHQFQKELAAARPSGMKPVVTACMDAGEQAAFVAQRALELRDEGIPLGEMAVLYRSHFHALELQLELTRRNIPFSITSGIRFFEQAHVKDVAAYLKLVHNPRDEISFKRLVRMMPGVGGKSADKLWNVFRAACCVSELDSEHATRNTQHAPPSLAVALQQCARAVPKKSAAAWAQFTATIAQLCTAEIRAKTDAMIRLVLEAGYEDYLKATYPNFRNRIEDLEQLASFARQFPTMEDFLTQLALLTNVEAEDNQPAEDEHEKIRLSSIHQAKGLEFRVVFVIMLCDGLFPSARSIDNPEGEEEERRLFYVAVTRAKDELYLSHPLMRFMQGGGDMMQQPSRFLAEIPVELREEWNLRPHVATDFSDMGETNEHSEESPF
ncbi:MAG: DNA helicase II / ATP-dependent DNA helicase PcrA [Limisphaerales bacterium]|nr:MAG: DNA helicase II / ATP-dependent DNA helicase PcrA [Limisphaerales bacterium]KAG0507595.1 MAG: DNA helicase II / ATP-dependent DNA helicase PcrA [Limisphaerales bacterium]TXT48560.1 MAG: DNA helicase II / ATP-dependent DNA helicase PcrA [Limisphaerales bacterium]